MSHILQGDDLCPHLVLCQFFAGDVRIFAVVRTVDAAVDTVVGEVERRKQDDTVAIESLA